MEENTQIYQNLSIEEARKLKLREILKDYYSELDENLIYFCKLIRQDLRNQKDCVIGVTGYPGMGKSQLGAVLGMAIDTNYSFDKNICFIPTSKEVENQYLNLPMYSVLHIDEASRAMHKHKWQDKMQQKLNELYDTDREGHYLCTLLLMPRFQNFTENFRNFRIKYWINIVDRGLCIVYKRDEDKDARDPWHLDENFKLKQKRWKNKRTYDRDVPSVIRIEQQTLNYWFYFRFPEIPKDIWAIYQELKRESRVSSKQKEAEIETENHAERLEREKLQRWEKIKELKDKGHTHNEIAAVLGCSGETVRRNLRSMEAYVKMVGPSADEPKHHSTEDNFIFNSKKNDKFLEIKREWNKEQNVLQEDETLE